MVMTPQTQPADIVIAAGRAYVNPYDSSGNPVGAKYWPQTSAITLSVSSEGIDVDDQDSAVATPLFTVTTKTARTGVLTCRDNSGPVMAPFLMADESTATQTATPVVAEPLNEGNGVTQGRYYQIGKTLNKAGARNISSVAVKDATPTTYTVTDDYVVDAASGMLYVVPDGAIDDDTVLLIDFTPEANTREQLVTNSDGAMVGELIIHENPARGVPRIWTIPYVEFSPNGDVQLQSRDGPREMSFNLKVQTHPDGDREQIYRDGVPVAS